MKFTPELELIGGRVRPLENADIDALFAIYQQPEIPGQRPLEDSSQCQRMIELSQQMAATQRGMMWLLEDDNEQALGVVSIYDWQPSLLRATIRIDGLPQLAIALRANAIQVCTAYMHEHYHVRNMAFQWVDGQPDSLKAMILELGFQQSAHLRESWRTAAQEFRDVIQFNQLIEAPQA